MSAPETLERAAALMRERAEDATPGRWIPFGNSIGAEVDGCTCHGGIEPYGHEQFCGVEGPVVQASKEDAEHIAPLATPAFARAVADLLDVCASVTTEDDDPNEEGLAQALAVARTYLGADQ